MHTKERIVSSLPWYIPAIFVFLSLVILHTETSDAATSELSEGVRILYREVTEAILAGDYSGAETIVRQFRNVNPDNPAGPLFAASVIQYAAIDYEDFSRNSELYDLIDETNVLAGALLKENPDDRWAKFFRAAADGLAGAHASLTGKVLTGIIRGHAGATAMSELIEADSTFYDAYLMAGSYHFWKSVATERIAWLPFIDDEKERGIAEVETAVRGGKIAGSLANTVLLEMLLEHDHEQALVLASDLHRQYPACRLFSWQLGEAYKRLGQFDEARDVFEEIAASMHDDPADDGSGELRCWWKLADLAYTLGDCTQGAKYCRLVIETGNHPAVSGRQKDRIERAQHILEECDR